MLLLIFSLLLQTPPVAPGDSIRQDAYLDPRAAELVAGARAQEARDTDRIETLTSLRRERVSAGLRTFRRDRLLYSREIAARVGWQRGGGSQVELMSARESVPFAFRGERPLEARVGLELADGPDRNWLLRAPLEGQGRNSSFRHPLAAGSEENYRFRTGEESAIRLADGRLIRLVELQVIPRRSESDLLSGSFWLEAESLSQVRGLFELAAPLRLTGTVRLGFLPITLPGATIELRHLLVEYGFWENQWWLPRLITLQGGVELAGVKVPFEYEEHHSDYEIFANGVPFSGFEPVDTTRFERVELECGSSQRCSERAVFVPRDPAELVNGELLPGVLSGEERWFDARDRDRLAEFYAAVAWRDFGRTRPRWSWSPVTAALLRYNRVEGLRLGTSLGVELAPLTLVGEGWVGIGSRSLGGRLALAQRHFNGRNTLELFDRVESFSPDDRHFSLGNSMSAFLFGRDEGDYYRARGVELISELEPGGAARLRIGAYHEQHDGLSKATDASLPHWLGDDRFRSNPAAEAARQSGAHTELEIQRERFSTGFRVGAKVDMRAERGSYDFLRSRVRVSTAFPLPGPFIAAIEGGAGTTFGTPPVQRLWYLGGASTVRGFGAEDRISGPAFWTVRAEIGNDFPGARVVLFADAGGAGEQRELRSAPMLASAGVGVSLLDGLVRADVARPLRGGGRSVRFELSLDAPL